MKAALIGTGQIAQQHLACLRSLADVTMVGVCDLSRTLAECTAERFGVGAWFTDHRAMFAQTCPEVVHVTTPPSSHFQLAMDALAAGAHVIVEKPVTAVPDELSTLLRSAFERHRVLVEDYNYLFNPPVERIRKLVQSGDLGEVVDVEVRIGLDIIGRGSPFVDRNLTHPCFSLRGGPIADFLPHLASLVHSFIGRHHSVRAHWQKRTVDSPLPYDEFRAIVAAERGTGYLSFSAHARPELFWIRVDGTRMRAAAELFNSCLVVNRLTDGPRPVALMRDRLREARHVRRAAWHNFLEKLAGGHGAYQGLWTLLARTYGSLRTGVEPPVSVQQIAEVNDLVAALTAEENRF
jgi:predicted dehydrogenase